MVGNPPYADLSGWHYPPGSRSLAMSTTSSAVRSNNSALVVLSACATAQGSLDYGEGVYGLVRALRIAGARQVLVTLWPVSDGEARDFITAFYRTWLEQDGSDPRLWAPYALVGP
jgi:CHAT domain-containing protein